MDTQFYLNVSNNVPNAGIQPIRLGMPDYRLMQNDICICKRNSFEFLPLNATILREALLNSKDFLRMYLGIEVKDVLQDQVVKQQEEKKPVRKKQAKPKVSEEPNLIEELQKDAELLQQTKATSDENVKTMEVDDLW